MIDLKSNCPLLTLNGSWRGEKEEEEDEEKEEEEEISYFVITQITVNTHHHWLAV